MKSGCTAREVPPPTLSDAPPFPTPVPERGDGRRRGRRGVRRGVEQRGLGRVWRGARRGRRLRAPAAAPDLPTRRR